MPVFLIAIPANYLPVLYGVLGLFGVIGLIALISPRAFAAIALRGGQWVDTSKIIAQLDTRIDLDQRVLPHSRWLGAAVVASVGVLGFVLARG